MISALEEEDIIKILALLLDYGIEHRYNYKNIEQRIINSKFIKDLENNEFDVNKDNEDYIKETYSVNQISLRDSDFIMDSWFYAESYLKFFYKFKKSFSYIFLYFPIELMIEKYEVYHQMDYSQITDFFNKLTKKDTLLKMLCKTKKIKLTDLSRITDININTLKQYSLSNLKLYNAPYKNIYRLSQALNVNENIFLEELNIGEEYSWFYKEHKNLEFYSNLGMYFAFNYDNNLKRYNFIYNSTENIFLGDSFNLKSLDINLENIDVIKEYDAKNIYLVLFYNDVSFIKEKVAKFKNIEIMIITNDRIYFLKNNKHYLINEAIKNKLYFDVGNLLNS